MIWLLLQVERRNIYLQKSREWLTVIDQSDICEVLGSVLFALVKTPIKPLRSLKTKIFLREHWWKKRSCYTEKKKKVYLIIRHSHYICLSHRLFFWFPATVQILRFGFIFRFLLLTKKNQNKWVIISYHFVDNVIFVSKHNLTVLIHSFPTRRIQSPTYWN